MNEFEAGILNHVRRQFYWYLFGDQNTFTVRPDLREDIGKDLDGSPLGIRALASLFRGDIAQQSVGLFNQSQMNQTAALSPSCLVILVQADQHQPDEECLLIVAHNLLQ